MFDRALQKSNRRGASSNGAFSGQELRETYCRVQRTKGARCWIGDACRKHVLAVLLVESQSTHSAVERVQEIRRSRPLPPFVSRHVLSVNINIGKKVLGASPMPAGSWIHQLNPASA